MPLPVSPLSGVEYQSVAYSQALINRASITPNDAGCQDWLADKLGSLGFSLHRFTLHGVSNLVASYGQGDKVIAFAGHTDVVPPGPLDKWLSDPFVAEVRNNCLYGRGAADMKTGLAAMLAAFEQHLQAGLPVNNRFVWLITSDEEGEAEYGSKAIRAYLDSENIALDMCIVGEPSANQYTGDAIKVGRRGALSARVQVQGRQGHVAYPQYADNAVHKCNQVMQALLALEWDSGSADFPGTSLQITHIDSGDFTDNIVPGQCRLCFNIRYSHAYTQAQLKALVSGALAKFGEQVAVSWERPCEPYFTNDQSQNSLIAAVERAIHKNTGSFPLLSTGGGTSDGRFFASAHTQVVELGVSNQRIHQVNESIHLTDLITLQDIYRDLLAEVLTQS